MRQRRCARWPMPLALLVSMLVGLFGAMPVLAVDGEVLWHQKISDLAGGFSGILDDADQFGLSQAVLGDLDNDGVVDIAVGAVLDDDGGLDRGAVWILFLNNDGTVKAHQKISNTDGGFSGLLDNSDAFGFSLAALGDLDGDGVTDLAVTAYADDDGGVGRGAVWILFLNSNGTVKAHQKISNTDGGFVGVLDDWDGFGLSVTNLGDLDSDNVADIAVGACSDDDGGSDRGAVWVLFLDTNGTVKTHQKISSTVGGFTGILDTEDNFAWSLAAIGDLDEDGVMDLAVGSRRDDDGGADRGAVWILFLDTDGTVKSHQKISSTSGGFTGTIDNSDFFASSVCALGDFNCDDILDIIVGAQFDDDGGLNRGALWLLMLNSDGTVKGYHKISDTAGNFTGGLDNYDSIGNSVVALGDLDGDGVMDISGGASGDDDGGNSRGAVWAMALDGQDCSNTEISVLPPYDLTNCATNIDYTFHIDHAGFQEIRGYTVIFQIDPAVVTLTTGDVTEETYLSSVAATAFYPVDLGSGVYSVDCAILGGSVGATGSGDLFTVSLTPVAKGTSAITITGIQLRDVNNVPLDVGRVDGVVQIDCTIPTMQGIVELQGVCYNTTPSFGTFRFRDDFNLDLADYQIDALGWNPVFSAIDDTVWVGDGWPLPGFGGLSEGAHAVYFRVKDDAGNWNGEGAPQPDLYRWQFIKDTTAPDAPADFLALPGHNKVHLTWTNPTGDASFIGVEIRRVGWGDYPEYGTGIPVVPAPSYPANQTEGTLVTQTALEAHDDDPATPRDIYNYAAFSYDCAGNYSAAGTGARDRSTSYWLGDIQPLVYDGNVNPTDLVLFSGTFGQAEGDPGWDAEVDFGPSDDYSRFGIPEPDDVIDFEDLMTFAMNYGNVSPAGVSPMLLASEMPATPLANTVDFELVRVAGDETSVSYAIVIKNEAVNLKGFAIDLSGGPGSEIVQIVPASAITGKASNNFFGTIDRKFGGKTICVAALGVDRAFRYTGEIARLTVRQGTATGAQVIIEKTDLRDLENQSEEITVAGGGGQTPFVPTKSALFQNQPNPFNPSTTINYDVPAGGIQVTLRIYDIRGTLIRTLLNNTPPGGRYTAQWDGRDNGGQRVSSGIYFYQLKAGGFVETRKMLLMK